jgi:hypothetical protein
LFEQKAQYDHQRQVFSHAQPIIVSVVERFVWRDILPAHHEIHLKTDPPQHQKQKIQHLQPCAALGLLQVRPKQKPREHQNSRKKHEHVTGKEHWTLAVAEPGRRTSTNIDSAARWPTRPLA